MNLQPHHDHRPVCWTSQPSAPLVGELSLPGDKSITHRAIIIGAMLAGRTDISGGLAGLDCLASLRAVQALGIAATHHGGGRFEILSSGLANWQLPDGPLDLGNSGTSMRLLIGALAGQPFDTKLIGDAQLQRRPMQRVIDPLTQMGAKISARPGGMAPLTIHGGRTLQPIRYRVPMASAQVKTALTLASFYCAKPCQVTLPGIARDHTERLLQHWATGTGVRTVQVPGDFSAAAFFIVAACIIPGSELVLRGVGINPTRCGLLTLLREMGADISLQVTTHYGLEPVADLRVRARPLKGIRVPAELVSVAIDELPIFFIAAASASGTTSLTELGELRVKESDRLATMAAGLTQLGIQVQQQDCDLTIIGGRLQAGQIHTACDHRIAMAFAIAGSIATGPIEIQGCETVATSFPNFLELAQQLKLQINEA